MVEVRFASVAGVEAGIKCTLDGVVKYTDEAGLCSFFGVSQGAHSYSVEAPAGWRFDYGLDYFNSPLARSGTTVIEWVPYPDIPFPETEPWMMKLGFEVGEEPEEPSEAPKLLGRLGAVVSLVGLVGIFVDAARKR